MLQVLRVHLRLHVLLGLNLGLWRRLRSLLRRGRKLLHRGLHALLRVWLRCLLLRRGRGLTLRQHLLLDRAQSVHLGLHLGTHLRGLRGLLPLLLGSLGLRRSLRLHHLRWRRERLLRWCVLLLRNELLWRGKLLLRLLRLGLH